MTPHAPDRSTLKSLSWWAVRIVLSALILGLTLWLLPAQEVWETFRRTPPGLCIFVFVTFLAGHVVTATKWWLLTGHGGDVALTTALRAHFAGLAANLCLPSIAGGDVVRAGLVARVSPNKSRIAIGSILDRLLDTGGLLGMALVAGFMTTRNEGSGPMITLVTVTAVLLMSFLGLFGLLAVGTRFPILRKLHAAAAHFAKQPAMLAACFVLSLLVQCVFVFLNTLLANASGIEIPAAAWFFAWPLAKLVAMIPISLGGLGVREASLAALLTPFGAAPAKVVAVGLLWQGILIASGLVGGLALVVSRRLESNSRAATPAHHQAEMQQ